MNHLAARSFAKINLGLRVLGRRDDGYHEIRTTLQTIDLCDEIRFSGDSRLSLTIQGGVDLPGGESNLVMKAARALERRCGKGGAKIELKKRIPAGAGLGGGSSNAAVTLMGLVRLWGMDAEEGLLEEIARGLGADVPFFLHGGTCLAEGRGDRIRPLPDAPSWHVIVAWPGMPLATGAVYGALRAELTGGHIPSSMKGFNQGGSPCAPVGGGLSANSCAADGAPGGGPPDLVNDLEETSFALVPRLRRIKERLLAAGAAAAAMSGSGSAIYGLFSSEEELEEPKSELTAEGAAVFVCRTIPRDAYHLKLFERS